MSDYELLKQTFDRLEVEYESTETLLGYSISLNTDTTVIYFEFHQDGSYHGLY